MIFSDDKTRKDAVYDMWQRNFQDPKAYADFYFDEVYGDNEVLILSEEEEGEEIMKGMIHLNPYDLCLNGQVQEASYIVGVATDEEFRRQGVMRRLLARTFQRLSEKGQPFTYLMPADENYYLPFDFRFGVDWYGAEVSLFDREGHKKEERPNQWDFRKDLTFEELTECAAMENEAKSGRFDLFTRITAEYLTCLGKEAQADYGYCYFAFDRDGYKGRFVLSPEHGYLILSRLFCRDSAGYGDFLGQILDFCKKEFGYSDFQLIGDLSFKESFAGLKGLEDKFDYQIRCLPVKKEKKIMFRITDPGRLSAFFRTEGDYSGSIGIRDPFFQEADGLYELKIGDGKLSMKKTDSYRENGGSFGSIAIADFTTYLFGGRLTDQAAESLSPDGMKAICAIEPLKENCIMEIV